MKTISLKVTDPFDVELAGMAKRHGMSKSALIREALETYLRDGRSHGQGSSRARKTSPSTRTTCRNSASDKERHSRHGSSRGPAQSA